MPQCGGVRESAGGESRSKRVLCSLTPELRLPTLSMLIRDGVVSALKTLSGSRFAANRVVPRYFYRPRIFPGGFYFFKKGFFENELRF